MYTPTLEEVKQMTGDRQPGRRSTARSWPTWRRRSPPFSRSPAAGLLPSGKRRGRAAMARYSFIGTEPHRVLVTESGSAVDPLDVIEEALARPAPGTTA